MADEKDMAAEAPKKSKKMMLIVAAAALVVLGGGGAGAFFMLKGDSAEAAPKKGIVTAAEDTITVNLADGHYLKLKMTLQATTDAAEAPDGSKALDIAIELFSNRSMDELLTAEGREKAKEELTAAVVKAYTVEKKKEVMEVYFTTFVIQ